MQPSSGVPSVDGAGIERERRRRAAAAGWTGAPLIVAATGVWGGSWLGEGDAVPSGWRWSEAPSRRHEAQVLLFHLPEAADLATLAKPGDQVWVGVSLESDVHHPHQRAAEVLERLDLLATYHQDSDVPLDYTAPGTLEDVRAPLPPKGPDRLACAFISNGRSSSGREALATELARWMPVHHYGRWGRTHTVDPDLGRPTKLAALASYHFCLAFENAVDVDYVTEKLFDCFVAGCVPVYLGAPNVEDFAPGQDSYVDVHDLGSPRELAHHLVRAAAIPEVYARYHAWRDRPLPEAFARRYRRRRPLLERICAVLDADRRPTVAP